MNETKKYTNIIQEITDTGIREWRTPKQIKETIQAICVSCFTIYDKDCWDCVKKVDEIITNQLSINFED